MQSTGGKSLYTRPLAVVLFLCLVFGPLYFVNLGGASLWEIDEAIYAEIAREMHESGDLVGTFFDYAPRFDKPPLTYWLMIVSFKLFGVNEFAVRFFSALFGLGGLLLLYAVVRWTHGDRVGALAALILGSSFEYPILAIIGLTDMPLTFFTILTFYGLWRAYIEERPANYLLAALGAALATLTKGPIGLLLPGGVLFLLVLIDLRARRPAPRTLLRPYPAFGAVLYLGLVLPWYLAMYHRFGRDFLASNFGYHMFARFAAPLEAHGQPWYFYLLLIFLALLPWSPGLLGGVRQALARRREPVTRLYLVWAGFYILFFSLARTKLPGYLMPALPPAAVMTALWWDRLLHRQVSPGRDWVLPVSLAVVGGAVWLALTRARDLVPPEYETLYRGLFLLPLVLIAAGFVLGILLLFVRRTAVLFAGFLFLSLLGLASLRFAVVPRLEAYKPTRYLAQAVARRRKPGEAVGTTAEAFAGLPFYLHGRVEGLSLATAASSLAADRRAYVITTRNGSAHLRELLTLPPVVLAVRGAGVLLTNQPDRVARGERATERGD